MSLKSHFQAFWEIVSLLTRHRQLTWEMTKREITDRYAGQTLGVFWSIGHPLILMAVYVFIFAFVFKQTIGGTRELPLDYPTYLLCGLIPWLSFQDAINKSATAITGNANLVKQVVFPIEILPVKGVITSFITQFISTIVLILYVVIKYGYIPASYALIPFIFILQIMAMIGMSYIISAIGVYFRDLKELILVFSVIGMYIMPICYLPSQAPKVFRAVFYLNPFSYLIWCYQDIFYFCRIGHWWVWAFFVVMSVSIFYFGYRIFRRLKVMFGNVL